MHHTTTITRAFLFSLGLSVPPGATAFRIESPVFPLRAKLPSGMYMTSGASIGRQRSRIVFSVPDVEGCHAIRNPGIACFLSPDVEATLRRYGLSEGLVTIEASDDDAPCDSPVWNLLMRRAPGAGASF